MKIYRLDVSRAAAGARIPFDRVYLAHGEARAAVKKLFSYCLVLPIAGEFKEMLRSVVPLGMRIPREGTVRPWDALLDSANDWVAVVPILPRRARDLMPTYLMNKSWYLRGKTYRERREKTPLPTLSFLQTPEQIFRPVCIACPRFTEHQAGKCQLGQRICLDTLVLGDVLPQPEPPEVDDVRPVQEELFL